MRRLFGPALALILIACASDPVSEEAVRLEPLSIRIEADAGSAAIRDLLEFDLKLRDEDGRIDWNAEAPLLQLKLVTGGDRPAGGFDIKGSDGSYAVSATEPLGLQYGAYELLERAGIVFLHPLETYFPDRLCVSCIGNVDEGASPNYQMRGTHMHTMHPIEYESTLLGNDEANIERYQRLLGWLIARRQNYIQWALLRTIDESKWIEYAKKLSDETHARGMKIGISAPIAFRQQNSFFLYDGKSPTPATEQMAVNIDYLMQVDWDYLTIEMGASEFIEVDDVGQVEWMNFLAGYLDENYTGTKTATKVHCTVNQTAPSYDDINFNYIVKYADAGMGVMPHTVQFYDLYRPGPTYDREDFSDMREFLLGEIGKRAVYYYPETAYWVTFDNDIPIYLPQYVYSRWKDLYELRDSGMDGQINFSSGFEWGYWQNDFAAAWYAYDPDEDYLAPMRRAFSIFGDISTSAIKVWDEYVRWQGEHLLEKNGVRLIISWDAADDVGHWTGIHGQPSRVRMYEIYDMSPPEVDDAEAELIPEFDRLVEGTRAYADQWQALGPDVRKSAYSWYLEVYLGMRITAIRADFMSELYRSVIALTRGETTLADAHLARAKALKNAALQLVAAQEKHYRFPHDEVNVERPSYTSYPFGYLRTVNDLWYWDREIKMATDPDGYDFLTSLYDMVAAAGLKD